jgi:hypothetical protein
MSDSLPTLEERRRLILEQIVNLGEFRCGSISAVVTRCGKPTCHCARPKDAGHGPALRLTYKVKGKSRIETLSAPGSLQKAQREIATFRQFQQQMQSLIEVNAALCRRFGPELRRHAGGNRRQVAASAWVSRTKRASAGESRARCCGNT